MFLSRSQSEHDFTDNNETNCDLQSIALIGGQ